ncbi:chymotrypsin BI-like [Penaeus japonicus]|uniref:chymotrypsin BI-like n=1 Tax=Penaeus japonicus TaxID=27405 RepID=UPI001C70FB5D|nr:chymotrypsin BI-like [Penaeus japonicus]
MYFFLTSQALYYVYNDRIEFIFQDANQATNISWIPLPTFPVSGPPLAAPRIVNGRTAEPHAYPYQAALSCNGRFLCGGSVISDWHVVTAAHCVDSPRKCKVVLGGHDLKRWERSRQIIAVGETYVHRDYSKKYILRDQVTRNLLPICFPLHP